MRRRGARPTHTLATGRAAFARVRASARWRLYSRGAKQLVIALLALAGAALLCSAPAFALSERGHTFNFAFGEVSGPSGVAVDEARSAEEGNVYVPNSGAESVGRFKCTPSSCALDPTFKPKLKFSPESFSPESIAVDNSSGPAKGDIYVASTEAVEKFKPSGERIVVIKGYKLEPGVEKEPFEEIHGVSVDANGDLYVYEGESVIHFNNAEKGNKALEKIEPFLTCERQPGFAVGPKGEALYVAHLLESRGVGGEPGCPGSAPAVIAQLDGEGNVLINALDHSKSTGVAVDLSSGAVYVDNVSEAAAFTASGSPVQRFGAGQLSHGRGLAVDSKTGEVFVAEGGETNKVAVFGLEPPGPPTVDSESALNVTPTEEKLTALIDPKGASTKAVFQYGTASCAESGASCTSVPAEPEVIGSGFGHVEAHVRISGLQPGTGYFYRVVASNEHGTANGAVQTFQTLPSPAVLPDNRGWELVSRAEKSGAGILPITNEGGLIQAAAGGDKIAYLADAAVTSEAEGNRALEPNQLLATRTSEGWSSRNIVTPTERGEGFRAGSLREYQAFNLDLSLSLVAPQPPEEAFEHPPLKPACQAQNPPTERTIYRRQEAPALCYEPLVSAASDTAHTNFGVLRNAEHLQLVGQSPDLGHAVVTSPWALTAGTPEPEAETAHLYEWTAGQPAAEQLQLVSVLPGGAELAQRAELGQENKDIRNAISADGSRVFFSGLKKVEGEPERRLFMRDTRPVTEGGQKTVQIDAAQGVKEPIEETEEEFQIASADGSRVFFTNESPLTSESSLPEEGVELKEGPDLYVCEISSADECHLTDLTVGQGESADVLGVLGASEDGSYVYFVADGGLAGAEPGKCGEGGGPEPTCNLYLEHYNSAAKAWEAPQVIARLSRVDVHDLIGVSNTNPAGKELEFHTARVSPGGRYVAFMSERSLTGYENKDQNPAAEGARDQEVYLYDAVKHLLVCASCNPSGARPHGVFDQFKAGEGLGLVADRPQVWAQRWLAANIPGWTSVNSELFAHYQSRYLNDEGRLFFNSADALVPQVTARTRQEEVNGKVTEVGVENVYEYEPAGVGGCHKEGCVGLISSGTSTHESAFVDASETGNDVFFVTGQPLVATDQDSSFDLYDARVCEPKCLEYRLPESNPCQGAGACRPTETPTPGFGAPQSSTFSGPGNGSRLEIRGSNTGEPPRLTNSQKLRKALAACRKKYKKAKRKRARCERQARRKYGPKSSGQSKRGRR